MLARLSRSLFAAARCAAAALPRRARKTQAARRAPRAILEELEPRVLYSADSPLALLGHAVVMSVGGEPASGVTPSSAVMAKPVAAGAEVAPARGSEVFFIDPRIADTGSLLRDLQAQRDAGRRIDIVVLDAGQDGVAQISAALALRHDVSAVHILSEGADGSIVIGNSRLDAAALARDAAQIEGWRHALTADADVLIYGCDVAATAKGRALVDALARLTGADVAASTDPTGSARLGGDWSFEYQVGWIDAGSAVSAATQQSWNGTLALYTVTNTNDSGVGSLRQAIVNANANAGTDTISFNFGSAGVHTINLTSALPTLTGAP